MQMSDLLTMSSAQVAAHNRDTAFFARRVYNIAGTNVLFERGAAPVDALSVKLNIGDQEIIVGLSGALANLFFNSFNAVPGELSSQWLDFMVRAHLPQFLPEQIVVLGVVEQQQFEHVLVGKLYGSNTPSGFAIGISGTDDLVALFSPFDSAVSGLIPPAFANTPIVLPLMASAFEVPAAELADLQVGDILLM